MTTFKVYPEHDDFVTALPGPRARYFLRAKQQRTWRMTSTELCDVVLTKGQEGAASIFTGGAAADSFVVFVSLNGTDSFKVDGRRLGSGEFAWMAPGCLSHIESDRPSSWLRIAIPHDAVVSRFASGDVTIARASLDSNQVRSARGPVTDLVQLARRIFRLESRGNSPLTPAVEQAIKRELMDTVYQMLVLSTYRKSRGRPAPGTQRALDRALTLIETRPGEKLKADELSGTAGVSERTLRNMFSRHFAMSPHRYLMITRLHGVRAAIHTAQPGDSVTSLCGDFGISDFGRFASQYRQLFGVLPSQDLAVRRRAELARRTQARTPRSAAVSPAGILQTARDSPTPSG